MDVRLPDGTIIRGVPDGTTREQLTAKLKANGYNIDAPASKEDKSPLQYAGEVLRDGAAGAIKGASNIGATLLAPYDIAKDAINGRGVSLESNRERRKQVTEALGELGADTKSTSFNVGELASEVAGTLGAGGVVANGLTRAAPAVLRSAPVFQQAVNAVRSGGFSTGARVAPNLGAQAGNLAVRAGGGAVNGLVSAGLINPDAAGTGALIGGAIPVVTKAAGAAGRAVGRAVSNNAARNAAVEKIAGAVGDDAALQQTVADIQTYFPKGAENIPVSSAAITQNPKLAQLEQGSRLRNAPNWFEFDQRQGKAVFDNVMDATAEAGELGARKGLRQENWQQAWAKAEESQKPRVWAKRMTEFGANLEQAMRSPQASNPEVRAVLEAINAEFDRVGPAFSPAHLQQLRANLNGKVQPLSGNVFKSAPRDNPAIKSLIAELDDILNVSTGGKWQKVLEGYAKDSDSVRAAAAASKVRGAFVDDATGRIVGPALDADTAKVTQGGLNRAMNAARLPDKSLALSADANSRLEATLEALRRQDVVRGLKNSATAGGGSDTVPNALAAMGAQQAGAPNLLVQLAGAVRQMGVGKTENQMARLLANPDALAVELERFLLPPKAPNKLAVLATRAAPALTAD